MALFGKRKKEEKVVAAGNEAVVPREESRPQTKTKKTGERRSSAPSVKRNYSGRSDAVLKRPRITEKATFAAEKRAYVFEVAVDATKQDIFDAIKQYYKVTPVKVNVVQIPRKLRMSRARRSYGVTAAGKKAYVYLKEGDTIDIT